MKVQSAFVHYSNKPHLDTFIVPPTQNFSSISRLVSYMHEVYLTLFGDDVSISLFTDNNRYVLIFEESFTVVYNQKIYSYA